MNIDEVRKHFEADKYLMMTDVVIEEVGDDFCICSLKINPDKHFNAAGFVQGGAIYTLADSAFAVACNINHLTNDEQYVTVGQSASISYLKAGAGGILYARAEKIGGGKKMASYRIDVTDEDGNAIATMIGNGYTVRKIETIKS